MLFLIRKVARLYKVYILHSEKNLTFTPPNSLEAQMVDLHIILDWQDGFTLAIKSGKNVSWLSYSLPKKQ